MARTQYYTGIDIGSSQVRVVVTQQEAESGEMRVLGVGETPTAGVQKGVVTDVEEAVQALNRALDAAERMAGVPIERAYVSINGSHVSSQNSRGVIAVSRADGEITADDVDRVVNAAQAISLPANREILHVLPQDFVVDGQEHIHDPVGMTGVRLEVEAHIIEGSAPFIKNLTKVVNQAGVHVEDFVFAPLAAALAVLEKRQKELGVVLVDMGGGTTSMVVYEEKTLLHTSVMPVGSSHITNDIAIGLRNSIDVAEAIKIEHGTALPDTVGEGESIVIEGEDTDEQEPVSRREVAEIIGARLEEMFGFVDRELKEIGRSGLLPAGVVLTGGGTQLPGLLEVAKQRLRLPVRMGRVQEMGGIGDKVSGPEFAVVLGLIAWAQQQERQGGGLGGAKLQMPSMGKSVEKIKDWLKAFWP